MKVTIEGSAKEIAALVSQVQEQQGKTTWAPSQGGSVTNQIGNLEKIFNGVTTYPAVN